MDTTQYAPVGSLVLSGYWQAVDRVLAHNPDGSVTVESVPDHPAGNAQWRNDAPRIRTHATPFDPKRDRIIEDA